MRRRPRLPSSMIGGRSRRPDSRFGYFARVTDAPEILWSPPSDTPRRSRMGKYLTWLGAATGHRFGTYDDLWRWSVSEPSAFWQSIWDHFNVLPGAEPTAALG